MYEYVIIDPLTSKVERTQTKTQLHITFSNYCDIGLFIHRGYTPHTELVYLNNVLDTEYAIKFNAYSEQEIQQFIEQQLAYINLLKLKE